MIKKAKEDMHVGIDFDNTIVSYDNAFYHQALKLGLINKGVAKNKQVIRDEIRKLKDGNDKWTELQGIVYGLHMDEADLIEGVDRFLMKCKEKNVKVSVISQKTEFPAMGPRANLREAARKWLEDKKFTTKFGVSEGEIFFETTIKDKVDRIRSDGCTHFIDDLPEVLTRDDFPFGVKRMLFSRTEGCDSRDVICFRDWDSITKYLFGGKNG